MPKLRDGSVVADRRLTRLPYFDVRSLSYAIADLFKKDQPLRAYTWKCNAVLDQGNEGACVGFAMAHELIAQPKVVKGIDAKFAREQIYWAAQRIDKFKGGSYPGASPKMEGSSVLAGIKVLKELGYVTEYRWAFSINDLALAVGYKGPAIIGIPWYEGMFKPASCGCLHPTGEKVGGHAIAVVGVNPRRQTFTLHNSWGPKWGNNGRAKITFDDLEKLLKESGEAVIPVVRRKKAA